MCGLVASVGLENKKQKKGAALSSLSHRGPDAAGEWLSTNEDVWLGHCRLSIVDLSNAGHQPMNNEDLSLWLICNGEIYNYPDLRSRLEGLGHQFYSNSDNEVILHAYEAWGEKCLEKMEGMFAFVLWDEKNKQLFAARDRVGIKPLYYTMQQEGVILSSEAGAILHLLPEKPSLDPLALAYILSLGYVPTPLSVWHGLKKLEPGSYLIWNKISGLNTYSYWQPPDYIEEQHPNTQEVWSSLFQIVTKQHLLSDVPLGMFLSGGLDSSSLALCLQQLGQDIEAITISLSNSERDESPIAELVAKQLGMRHQIFPIAVEDVNELLQRTMAAFDEPQAYGALLTMYLVSQQASRRYKVVLAGDGGDEVFGGYTWYQNLQPLTSYSKRKLLRKNASVKETEQAMVAFSHSSVLHRHAWRVFPRYLPEELEQLFSPLGLRFGDEEMLAPFHRYYVPKLPLRRALQRIDLMTFCSGSILAKVDRASMAHALEVRVPFLDRRIIEWGLTTPVAKREFSETKPVLRDFLSTNMPPEVLSHPKQGFSLGVMSNYDWNKAIERIDEGFLVKNGFVNNTWKDLLKEGIPYRTGRIWGLLCITEWATHWLN